MALKHTHVSASGLKVTCPLDRGRRAVTVKSDIDVNRV